MKSSPGTAFASSREHMPEIAQILCDIHQGMGLAFSDPEKLRVDHLFGDGSNRRFYRVRDSRSSHVILVSPRKNMGGVDENDSYHLIGEHLRKCGIPVPQIYGADPERGLFVLEDLGDAHLQGQANRGGVSLKKLYRHVVMLLLDLHKRAPDGFTPEFCFDAPVYDAGFVYERELEYFRKAFLVEFLGYDVGEEDLRREFESLAEDAGVKDSHSVIHRDFQSRNIMVSGGKLRIIDFQGMRFGPPAYDLASVLLDPYVSLPMSLQEGLARLYWIGARKFLDCSASRFRESYVSTRLSRNLQALGAYGFLGCVKGKTQFFQHIPRALKQLEIWLDGPCRNRCPRLRRIVAVIAAKGPIRRKTAVGP